MQPRGAPKRWDNAATLQRALLGPEVEARFGAPYFHFHRGDLAALLCQCAIPSERTHAGHRLVELDETGDGSSRVSTTARRPRPTCWIGAAASTSRVRHLVFGPERLRFRLRGVAGLVPAERIAHLDIEGGVAQLDGAGRALRITGSRPGDS